MAVETAWLGLVGLLLAGYLVLGGYDYGVQMLHPVLARDEAERRMVLNSFGPFFLGNEVWLVAFVGVLFGAFPFLEGTLLSGTYIIVAPIVFGVMIGNAAVQLRSRFTTVRMLWIWDRLVLIGGLVPALGWGLLLGLLLRGVPSPDGGYFTTGLRHLADPFVAVCGLAGPILFAGHGAAFLALRTEGALRARARRVGGVLAATAACVTLLALALGVASGVVAEGRVAFGLSLALPVALLAAVVLLYRGGHRAAFATTCCAAALPVAIVGFGLYPYVLVSDTGAGMLTVVEGAADTATLQVLTVIAAPLIPLLILFQVWNWWAFRRWAGGRRRVLFY